MQLLIIGTGYVGLVTGVCFAEMGHEVICLDIDEDKIKKMQAGQSPIYEPGLEELLKRNLASGRLSFTSLYSAAVKKSQAIFLALPTPSNPDGSCNTSFLEKVTIKLAKHIDDYKVIINKSTSPTGTLFKLKDLLSKHLSKNNAHNKNNSNNDNNNDNHDHDDDNKIDFDVVSNPEFLKEGSAILDCMKPERIIIGAENEKAFQFMREIYKPFLIRSHRIIEMDVFSSELTKYAANAMLATRISFMNELSQVCKRIGANINDIRKGIGSDSRIGDKFLYAGIGYGGSCFPKDIRALIHISKSLNYEPQLLEAVESINEQQKKELSQTIQKYFSQKDGLKGKTIAIWGLAFKPDTDDMRDAPSLTIIRELVAAGAKVQVFDPVAMENAKVLLKDFSKNITFCQNEQEAAHQADAIALLTEWKQFRLINFDPILKTLNKKVLFDGRNQYKAEEMVEKGFKYFGIGAFDFAES